METWQIVLLCIGSFLAGGVIVFLILMQIISKAVKPAHWVKEFLEW